MKRRGFGALTVTLLFGAGGAAAQAPRAVANFPLRLMDLSFVADSVRGVQILMQPSVRSKQTREQQAPVWLRFDPDTVLAWLNSAAAALRIPVPNGPDKGIQWSRTLTPVAGPGGLSLGRERKKGKLDETRWLAIADSTGWRSELTGAEADSLLQLLLNIGMQSRLDTSATMSYEREHVDVPAQVLHQPAPRIRGKLGQVVATYVVDERGNVDPATFVALLASDPSLIPEAWSLIKASRFKPAELKGKPVRQLVSQVIVWRPGN